MVYLVPICNAFASLLLVSIEQITVKGKVIPLGDAGFIAAALAGAMILLQSSVHIAAHALWMRLAMLAPLRSGKPRGRHVEPLPPLEATHPAAALALRQMQRNPRSRMLSAATGSAAMAMEDGIEGNLLLHYTSPQGSLTLAGGWLGSGRRRYIWVPLRPTLAWNGRTAEDSVSLLTSDEITEIAKDLHDGLTILQQRHAIEEFLPPNPIPADERQRVMERYTSLLGIHGWTVSVAGDESQRTLKRKPGAISADDWPQADREELARLEALVAQVLKGKRSSSRILYQDK